MRFRTKGRLRVIEIVLVAALAGARALPAFATETHEFNVPAEAAPDAIRDFASQAHVQILVAGENVKDKHLHAVNGEYSTDQGLRILLADSGLAPQYTGDRSIALVTVAQTSTAEPDLQKEGKKSSSEGFRVAQVDQGAPAALGAAASASQSTAGRVELEEVLVTAQKRAERALDVPVPLTVVDTEALANTGAGRIQDYYATVPGLSLLSTLGGGGTQYVTIRGLSTTSSGAPTVAMVIDDVPVGGSTGLNLSQWGFPDIDPSDLARIEVLKGPQGTLYGADSLGGLIKAVTRDPSTSGYSGHIQLLGQDIPNGGAGYGVRGSVNVPISDSFALRASAFARRDPGYIDNVTTGQDNLNSANAYGARLGALWLASEGVSLKLGAMFQNTQGFGVNEVNTNILFQPTLGDLQQTYLREAGRYNTQIQLYTATITAKLNGLTFVSVSGYDVTKWSNYYDATQFLFLVTPYFPQATASTQPNDFALNKFSQEFRFSGAIGSRFDWLAGAFYTHESSPLKQYVYANDATTGSFLGAVLNYHDTMTFHEYAVFGDLTVHFTDRFDIQVGGRESWSSQVFQTTTSGVGNVPPAPELSLPQSGTAFTYLVTPEFKISPDAMVYVRIASGYRIGGPNFPPTVPGESYPLEFGPDKTTNYDLGFKASLLDHKVTLDASAYYINWRDIQVGATVGCCFFQFNGGTAKSEGLEVSIQWHPFQGTTISAGGSLNNAELTQDLPSTGFAYGLAGDRLPYSVRASGSLGVEQDVVHFAEATGFVGADVAAISSRYGEFASGPPSPATPSRLVYPDYTAVNLRAGMRYQSWLVNLFANNIGDKRGIIGGGPSYAINNPAYYASVIQPRTFGLSISRDF